MVNGYTAIGLTPSLASPLMFPGYVRSVTNGVQSAERNIADLVRLCPLSQIVLGGFSQGAQVMRQTLARLGRTEREQIAAVVLFGDPYFIAKEPNVKAERSTDSSGTFRRSQTGILRLPRRTSVAVEPQYAGRVFSWCHRRDIVCQGLLPGNWVSTHKTYANEAKAAVNRIADRLRARGVRWRLAATSLSRDRHVRGGPMWPRSLERTRHDEFQADRRSLRRTIARHRLPGDRGDGHRIEWRQESDLGSPRQRCVRS